MPNSLSTTRRKQRQVQLLIARDGYKCHYCGVIMNINRERDDDTATRDHVIPKSLGGLAMLINFVLACNKCNNQRGNEFYFCFCSFCRNVRKQYYRKVFEGCRYGDTNNHAGREWFR